MLIHFKKKQHCYAFFDINRQQPQVFVHKTPKSQKYRNYLNLLEIIKKAGTYPKLSIKNGPLVQKASPTAHFYI
ncbi:hypothetical protein HMPREF0201_03161 [Cedecea davisae DSM 4568]|uniref:Uncharacterized protein n=1 Tax=Cedecea davisae DSM 4568 TaxID=566551 RepID=S3JS15_9ENTR|nr:hypothetical protein HMPREF0201_03161 [Cedecea davisae DSM 4568]